MQQNVHKHLQLEIINYYTYLLSLNTRDSQALSDLPVTLRIKLEKRAAAKRPAVASQVLSLEQRVAGVETKLETMERLIVAGFDDLRRGNRPPPRGPAAPARALHDAPALARTPVAPPAPSRLSFPPAEAAAPPAPRVFTPVAPRSPVARAAAAPAPPAAPQTPFERHVAAFRAAAADDAAASREHAEDPRLNPTAGED